MVNRVGGLESIFLWCWVNTYIEPVVSEVVGLKRISAPNVYYDPVARNDVREVSVDIDKADKGGVYVSMIFDLGPHPFELLRVCFAYLLQKSSSPYIMLVLLL